MRYLEIEGTLPIPNEANKLVENVVLKVVPSLDTNDIPLKVTAFESIGDLKANSNPIVSYEGFSIPHNVIIGTKDNENVFFDRLDTFNQEKEIGNIVSTTYGIIGNAKILVKEGETEHYTITYQPILEANNDGKNVIDKASLFACKILKQKIEQNYSERVADGRIKSITILEI